jgi:hypothetical protein
MVLFRQMVRRIIYLARVVYPDAWQSLVSACSVLCMTIAEFDASEGD